MIDEDKNITSKNGKNSSPINGSLTLKNIARTHLPSAYPSVHSDEKINSSSLTKLNINKIINNEIALNQRQKIELYEIEEKAKIFITNSIEGKLFSYQLS